MLLCRSSSSGQDALQLFHKMQTALGGAEKIADIQDFEQSVRAETWDNQDNPHGLVRKRTRWVRPDYLRLDQVGPDDTYVLYFDGTTGGNIAGQDHRRPRWRRVDVRSELPSRLQLKNLASRPRSTPRD